VPPGAPAAAASQPPPPCAPQTDSCFLALEDAAAVCFPCRRDMVEVTKERKRRGGGERNFPSSELARSVSREWPACSEARSLPPDWRPVALRSCSRRVATQVCSLAFIPCGRPENCHPRRPPRTSAGGLLEGEPCCNPFVGMNSGRLLAVFPLLRASLPRVRGCPAPLHVVLSHYQSLQPLGPREQNVTWVPYSGPEAVFAFQPTNVDSPLSCRTPRTLPTGRASRHAHVLCHLGALTADTLFCRRCY